MHPIIRSSTLALVSVMTMACEAESGTLEATAYGESFIEDGIPATAFADGWSVAFDRFTVDVSEVVVGSTLVVTAASVDVAIATGGLGQELGEVEVPEGRHAQASFTLQRIDIVGTASRGDEQRSFQWLLEEPTHYHGCESSTEVRPGGVGRFQVTVHADHLFYDSVAAESPMMRFQHFADADANGDTILEQGELAATGLGALDAGSEGHVHDLWGWLLALARTLGHVDGEGHCHVDA